MFRRRAAPFVVLSALAVAAGCRPAAAPSARPTGPAPNAAAGDWSSDQRKAADLAREFLAKNGTDWGEPTAAVRQPAGAAEWVGKPEDTFLVTYPTPPKERQALGPRAVFVNVRTGKAMFVPRD